eukprot:8780340-Pyramimonas_sp.AAC.1
MTDPGKIRDNTFASDELSAGLKAAREQLTSQVDSEEDRANVPYNMQVNVDMYTEENRKKRLMLKQDKEPGFGLATFIPACPAVTLTYTTGPNLQIIAAIDRWKILVGAEDAVKNVGMRAYMR